MNRMIESVMAVVVAGGALLAGIAIAVVWVLSVVCSLLLPVAMLYAIVHFLF